MPRRCRCGHDETAHEHYRPGVDCALCGRAWCRTYRPDRPSVRDLAAWAVARWRTWRWWRQVARDDQLIDLLATGRPAPRRDRPAQLLAAWRDETRREDRRVATSYNGWLASPNPADFGGLAPLVVAGESFAPGVRAGDVHTVLQYVAEQLHARVEPVVRGDWHQADDWGYAYRANVNNPNTLSCHASGTAIDYNATRHPNGRRGTFTLTQVAEIRRILAEVDGVVRWGGAFVGTPDEMHFEVIKGAGDVARVAARLRGASHPTIRRGDTGEAVELIQRFLGVVRPGDPGYGHYGPLTEMAVRRYQAMRGLVADGICGPATWAETGL